MSLVAVILILICWGVLKLKDTVTPSVPALKSEDLEKLFKKLDSLPNAKVRRKYLNNFAKECRQNSRNNNNNNSNLI